MKYGRDCLGTSVSVAVVGLRIAKEDEPTPVSDDEVISIAALPMFVKMIVSRSDSHCASLVNCICDFDAMIPPRIP